jgi:hypothetical protein
MQVVGNIKYVCMYKNMEKKSTRQLGMAWFSKQQMRFMNFIFLRLKFDFCLVYMDLNTIYMLGA